MPLVSVIMSTFNGSKFIESSIRSLLAQSLQDFEVVIVDDGSEDSTPGILAKAAQRDSRLRVFRRARGGLTSALNQGILSSSGKYIARQDDDDVSDPQRLETQVRFLDKNQGCGLVGSGHKVISEDGQNIETHSVEKDARFLRKALLRGNHFCHGSILARRGLLDRIGGYREAFHMAQDYDLVLRASEAAGVHIMPETLYWWRQRKTAISRVHGMEQRVFSLLAKTFARERSYFGNDSYSALALRGRHDLAGIASFVAGWRMRRTFILLASMAFAGEREGREMLGRIGIGTAVADAMALPKMGLRMVRRLGSRGVRA